MFYVCLRSAGLSFFCSPGNTRFASVHCPFLCKSCGICLFWKCGLPFSRKSRGKHRFWKCGCFSSDGDAVGLMFLKLEDRWHADLMVFQLVGHVVAMVRLIYKSLVPVQEWWPYPHNSPTMTTPSASISISFPRATWKQLATTTLSFKRLVDINQRIFNEGSKIAPGQPH